MVSFSNPMKSHPTSSRNLRGLGRQESQLRIDLRQLAARGAWAAATRLLQAGAGRELGKLVVFVVVFGYQRTRKIMDMTKIIEILYDNNQLSVILGMMIL